jgi:hypothetical protein
MLEGTINTCIKKEHFKGACHEYSTCFSQVDNSCLFVYSCRPQLWEGKSPVSLQITY